MKKTTLWIAKTAMMIALLLLFQFSTASFSQYVTGTCVNFVLAMSVYIGGFASGIVVATLSPIFAFMLGIGPVFLLITPCISAGNFAFVLVLSLLWAKYVKSQSKFIASAVCVAAGSAAKFITLYLLVVKLVLPSLGLPEQKLAAMSAMFTFPQLITAFAGGLLATYVASRVAATSAKRYFASQK